MPTPTDPSRFPPAFQTAFETARANGTLFIPSDHPHALKCQLWGFARAMRTHGQKDLADAIQVCVRPGGIELRSRSHSPAAREVEAALKSLPGTDAGDALFDRITPRG